SRRSGGRASGPADPPRYFPPRLALLYTLAYPRVGGGVEAESSGRLSERAWLLIACLGGCLLLRAAAGGSGILVGLLLAHLDRATPVPVWAVGLAAALFYGSELLGAPIFGLLSDRHGRRPYLLVSPLFGSRSASASALARARRWRSCACRA